MNQKRSNTLFNKNGKAADSPAAKQSCAFGCSVCGILLNLLLFLAKLCAGAVSGSVTITADGFNNLSDAGTTFVSMLGFKAASCGAGKRHPFGHGRLEWIMGMFTSLSVLLIGVEMLQEAVRAIKKGAQTHMNALIFVILLFSIAVKLIMFWYNRAAAKRIGSTTLQAVAEDSIGDAVSTTAVLFSALIGTLTGWRIDGWCGIGVALIILYGGGKTLIAVLEKMIGVEPEENIRREIEALVHENGVIKHVYDLRIHDYGFGNFFVSAVIMGTKAQSGSLYEQAANISHEIYKRYHYDSVIQPRLLVFENDTQDCCARTVKKFFEEEAKLYSEFIRMEELYILADGNVKTILMELVLPIALRKKEPEIIESLELAAGSRYPEYELEIRILTENDHMEIWRKKHGKASSDRNANKGEKKGHIFRLGRIHDTGYNR